MAAALPPEPRRRFHGRATNAIGMKITTWNVNGIRARLTHVIDFLRLHGPDVLCLQETKVTDDQFPREALEDEGYEVSWYGQKGYNGMAILSSQPQTEPIRGLPGEPADADRRVLGATIGDYRVLDLYVPNGQDVGTDKYRYKLDWFQRLQELLRTRYRPDDRLVVVGDFNVAVDDRDVHDPVWWHERILCSTPERAAMRGLFALGLQDTLRLHTADGGIYTWWHYRAGAAFKDDGLRIDYVLASAPAAARCSEVIVHKEVRQQKSPSDHVPVTAVFADEGTGS
jgi:exodeoxyribonuclease III